jgi:hypothetical protein
MGAFMVTMLPGGFASDKIRWFDGARATPPATLPDWWQLLDCGLILIHFKIPVYR